MDPSLRTGGPGVQRDTSSSQWSSGWMGGMLIDESKAGNSPSCRCIGALFHWQQEQCNYRPVPGNWQGFVASHCWGGSRIRKIFSNASTTSKHPHSQNVTSDHFLHSYQLRPGFCAILLMQQSPNFDHVRKLSARSFMSHCINEISKNDMKVWCLFSSTCQW